MVNGSSILVFVLVQKRFVGEVVHGLQAEQGVVEVVVVGFDILQGGDALTGREFVPDFACLAGIYLILAGNLVYCSQKALKPLSDGVPDAGSFLAARDIRTS